MVDVMSTRVGVVSSRMPLPMHLTGGCNAQLVADDFQLSSP
jgi:hypothetical protein